MSPTKVFYDGACPLCRREIAFLSSRRGIEGALDFVDVSTGAPTDFVAPALTRDRALRRMHAALPDGRIVSGADAFLAIWSRVPALRPLVALLRVPPLPWLLERLYRGFLIVRPRLQAVVAGCRLSG